MLSERMEERLEVDEKKKKMNSIRQSAFVSEMYEEGMHSLITWLIFLACIKYFEALGLIL